MRITPTRRATAALAAVGVTLLPAGAAAAADPTPPVTGSVTVTKAGTSFLTATAIGAGQPAKLAGSTGDYLYWSFVASAGQTNDVAITVTLPPTQNRHDASTWTIDVFDGLRRRQACTAGAQTPTASAADSTVALGCTLRQVRSWAEPWSSDPLPGTYYVRLSVIDLPEPDLGLPIQVDMLIGVANDGDPMPEGGSLKAPLVPAVNPGVVLDPDGSASTDAAAQLDQEQDRGWFPALAFPELSARWIWTGVGGILAAVAGVVGFALTRPRRRSVR